MGCIRIHSGHEPICCSNASAWNTTPPDAHQKRMLLVMQAAGKDASKVEGVGLGAVAAAEAYGNFDVSKVATWKAGEPVPFTFLASTFETIASTTKRLEITHFLVGAFRTILGTTPEDLLPVVYLCTNQVCIPSHTICCASPSWAASWFGLLLPLRQIQ